MPVRRRGVVRGVFVDARRRCRASCSHSSSLGTSSAGLGRFGLEMIPTVLMMGMEEKLLVPFGAEDGAFHDAGLESQFPHRAASRVAQAAWWSAGSRTMPPLPTWPLPTSNCGLISITICPPGCNSGTAAGRIRVTEMKLTSQVSRSTGSPISSSCSSRALMPSCSDDARVGAQLPVELAGADIHGSARARRRPAAARR